MHCSEAIYLDHYGKQVLPVCLKRFHEFSFWLVLRSPLAMHVVQIDERGQQRLLRITRFESMPLLTIHVNQQNSSTLSYTVNIYRYKALGANATSSVISTTWKCISPCLEILQLLQVILQPLQDFLWELKDFPTGANAFPGS